MNGAKLKIFYPATNKIFWIQKVRSYYFLYNKTKHVRFPENYILRYRIFSNFIDNESKTLSETTKTEI